jgi:hypothetical protein
MTDAPEVLGEGGMGTVCALRARAERCPNMRTPSMMARRPKRCCREVPVSCCRVSFALEDEIWSVRVSQSQDSAA